MAPYLLNAFPVFTVSDLAQALHFYRDQLGFIVHWQWGSPAVRAGVMRDGIELHLHLAEAGETPGHGAIYVHMTGIEPYYAQCQEAGTQITRSLDTRPWGVVDFAVQPPDGNRVGFAQRL